MEKLTLLDRGIRSFSLQGKNDHWGLLFTPVSQIPTWPTSASTRATAAAAAWSSRLRVLQVSLSEYESPFWVIFGDTVCLWELANWWRFLKKDWNHYILAHHSLRNSPILSKPWHNQARTGLSTLNVTSIFTVTSTAISTQYRFMGLKRKGEVNKNNPKCSIDWIVDEYGPKQMASSLKTHLW